MKERKQINDANTDVRFGDVKIVCKRYTIGRTKAIQLGKDAGAVVHFGGSTRYDLAKMDAYFESLRG